MANYRIKWRGVNHPVMVWARERNVKWGTWYPAPCPLMDKPFGTKGLPVPYDNTKLNELLLLNGNNMTAFRTATRIGAFLFNTVSNKHLIPFLKGLLWWQQNYVPFPLPAGVKALAEKIYCDGNSVLVDKVQGQWAHLLPGIGYLTQVAVGTGARSNSNVRWKMPSGWVALSLLEKI